MCYTLLCLKTMMSAMNGGGGNAIPRRTPLFSGSEDARQMLLGSGKKTEVTSNAGNCAPSRFVSHLQQVIRCHVADGEAEILLLSNWHVRMLISQARLSPIPSDRKDMLMSISTTVQYWASACSEVDQDYGLQQQEQLDFLGNWWKIISLLVCLLRTHKLQSPVIMLLSHRLLTLQSLLLSEGNKFRRYPPGE